MLKIFYGFLFLLAYLIFSPYAQSASKFAIYFYNPETNINNFVSLKIEFDTYLSEFGSYQLQPFSDRSTFEKFISEKTDGIFILSSWHYKNLKDKMQVNPQLVGVSKGTSTHKKVLTGKISAANSEPPSMEKGGNIASASTEDYTTNILKEMLHKDVFEQCKILTVPKDIDALMSVGFGMATFALTTEYSLTKLSTVNPKLFKMLKPIALSENKLMPIVASPRDINEDIKKLIDIVQKMATTQEGEKLLQMLGLDTWKPLNEQENKYLNQ
ncbi:MAG: hypothetical protein HQK77_11345 [Desulfobacterales bacterium]|nr:hypothetical protein [Desulfobacterales bacterium]